MSRNENVCKFCRQAIYYSPIDTYWFHVSGGSYRCGDGSGAIAEPLYVEPHPSDEFSVSLDDVKAAVREIHETKQPGQHVYTRPPDLRRDEELPRVLVVKEYVTGVPDEARLSVQRALERVAEWYADAGLSDDSLRQALERAIEARDRAEDE